jgi:hypothetical protein
MHKFPLSLAHEVGTRTPRPTLVRIAFIVFLGLVLAPPIEEGAAVCLGQWYEVMGENTEVPTPIFDAAQEGLQVVHREMSDWVSPQFHRLPWNPSFVLPLAAGVTALAMMMLKL